jgi:hypothetical protein
LVVIVATLLLAAGNDVSSSNRVRAFTPSQMCNGK